MKFCPNCGIELENNTFKFCPECGYKFGSDIPQTEPKEFINGILRSIHDETDKYVDKLRDNESLDGIMENAKTILKGSEKKDVGDEKVEIKIDKEDINQEAKNTKEDTSNKEEDEFIQDETYTEDKKNINTVEETISEPYVKQETEEIDYTNLFLSDLEETLIKTLPIINNPYEYEENIIKKYSEYNSEERKELLKDCWTVTKLAEKHNITRHEVEKTILTDEFLYKNLIGVFKVNPNNIRSLKILYRKPLNQKQQKQEISDETKEEKYKFCPKCGIKINENTTICPNCGINLNGKFRKIANKYSNKKSINKIIDWGASTTLKIDKDLVSNKLLKKGWEYDDPAFVEVYESIDENYIKKLFKLERLKVCVGGSTDLFTFVKFTPPIEKMSFDEAVKFYEDLLEKTISELDEAKQKEDFDEEEYYKENYKESIIDLFSNYPL